MCFPLGQETHAPRGSQGSGKRVELGKNYGLWSLNWANDRSKIYTGWCLVPCGGELADWRTGICE